MTTRGTSNSNARGSAAQRRRRREWLVETYRADCDARPSDWIFFNDVAVLKKVPIGEGEKACRCYRCGCLLTVDTLTVDRIIPGCKGGTYRRDNIRPACAFCNSSTGGCLASRAAA